MGNHTRLLPDATLDKRAFTYQLSDHLPLWVQLNVDLEGQKLDPIINKEYARQEKGEEAAASVGFRTRACQGASAST